MFAPLAALHLLEGNCGHLGKNTMKKILLDDSGPVTRTLWDPRTGHMEETNNRALQLLEQLMDRPGVDIEALERVADICDGEEGP